jgi:uncharacterized protein YegP (UPF0339 family)
MAGKRHAETYERRDGNYGWRRVSANGNITATGGEGYRTEEGARRAAERENPGLPIKKSTRKR